MANAPRPGAGRRADADAVRVGVRVNDVDYVLRPNEITAKQTAALRRETGVSLQALMKQAETDPDIDTIAALVWLARLQTGETVAFDDVAAEIGYDSTIDELSPEEADAATADDPSL